MYCLNFRLNSEQLPHQMLNRMQSHLFKNSKNLFCRLFLSVKQMACAVTVRTAEPEN